MVLFGEFERNLMKRAKLGTISHVQCDDDDNDNFLQLQFKIGKEKCEMTFDSNLEDESIFKGKLDLFD
jgi:hypothetical protein